MGCPPHGLGLGRRVAAHWGDDHQGVGRAQGVAETVFGQRSQLQPARRQQAVKRRQLLARELVAVGLIEDDEAAGAVSRHAANVRLVAEVAGSGSRHGGDVGGGVGRRRGRRGGQRPVLREVAHGQRGQQ